MKSPASSQFVRPPGILRGELIASHWMLWTYCLLGPLAWVALLALFALGREKMLRMQRKRYPLPSDAPTVTVYIPAKNEGPGLRECLLRALASDYPKLDVVAINDRSIDETPQVIDAVAAESQGRLRAIHIAHDSLPEGWLGKCNALHVATRDLHSDWLMFIDSDVLVEPDAIRDAVATAIERHYDAVSISTRLVCHTTLEKLVLPLAAGTWTILFAAALTNNDHYKTSAIANGQFFLIRREAYEAVGGHAAVREHVTEDVELMRLMKGADFRTRLFMAPRLASTRMHATFDQMLNGWGRIYCGTARRKPPRILFAIAFVILCGLSIYPAFAYGLYLLIAFNYWMWLAAAAVHYCAMTLLVARLYYESGNSLRYALAFPVAIFIELTLLLYALRMCWTGKVRWRGANVNVAAAP